MRSQGLYTGSTSERAERFPQPFYWMVQLWIVWLAFYFGGGLLAQSKGETGFFAATVDHVDSLWLKLSLLNIPLQLACMALTLALLQVGSTRAMRAARAFGIGASVLVVGHALLSFATASMNLTARL
ncbi:MAG: DMSO/TMAO reductase YedYZ heme-binding membrane subunit [Chlamydiales bacterium]|jgi:DMSO/TMAO reductase YedYZ heme-binding membrane subunit